MKSYWIAIGKPQVLEGITKAGLTDKEIVKLILTFERRVCTCQNMLSSGSSWETMNFSNAYNDASMAISEIEENHFEAWEQYTDARGFAKGCNLGDFLA